LHDLVDGEVGDELLVGFTAAGVEAGLVLDEFGRRRDTDLDTEGAVVLVVDGDGHFGAVERFGFVVNLLHDCLHVYRCRSKLGTEGRARVGLPAGDEHFDSSSHTGFIPLAGLKDCVSRGAA